MTNKRLGLANKMAQAPPYTDITDLAKEFGKALDEEEKSLQAEFEEKQQSDQITDKQIGNMKKGLLEYWASFYTKNSNRYGHYDEDLLMVPALALNDNRDLAEKILGDIQSSEHFDRERQILTHGRSIPKYNLELDGKFVSLDDQVALAIAYSSLGRKKEAEGAMDFVRKEIVKIVHLETGIWYKPAKNGHIPSKVQIQLTDLKNEGFEISETKSYGGENFVSLEHTRKFSSILVGPYTGIDGNKRPECDDWKFRDGDHSHLAYYLLGEALSGNHDEVKKILDNIGAKHCKQSRLYLKNATAAFKLGIAKLLSGEKKRTVEDAVDEYIKKCYKIVGRIPIDLSVG